jgi:hypothetical protein
MKSSDFLIPGQLYSRKQLSGQFGITDATLRTGVFKPKGYDSVWLFVTERKSKDQTPYSDKLSKDVLEWDGQTSGATDHLVIRHVELNLELLLFYREEKTSYPDYAFRYEGPFEYVSHSGGAPTHFKLRRAGS